MTILGTRRSRSADVDPRRLGVRTAGVGSAPLALAARLAEADRALPHGLHLLLLEVEGTAAVHVTLVDGAGDPVWMGAMPVVTGGAERGTCLPAVRDHETDRRLRVLGEAMRAVGFAQRTAAWFRWEL